jgi:hypothetical protein
MVLGSTVFAGVIGTGDLQALPVFALWVRGGRQHRCHTERAAQAFADAIGAGGIVEMPVFTLCMRSRTQHLCHTDAREKATK